MIAIAFLASALFVIPIGGQPLGAYVVMPIHHGIRQLVKRIHHQKTLKHRPDATRTDSVGTASEPQDSGEAIKKED